MVKKLVGYYNLSDTAKEESWYDILGFEIEKIKMTDYIKGNGRFCPAIKKSLENVFEIKSPFDIELKHEFLPDGRSWVEVSDNSSLKPGAFDDIFHVNPIDDRNDIKKPLLQMKIPLILLSDDDIEVELLPPLAYYNKLPGITAVGKVNIYKWHRPVNWVFEWHEPEKPIIIKRGEPLIWLKFTSKNRDDIITLKKVNQTDDMYKSLIACRTTKNVSKVTLSTWDLNLKNRKKYLIKSHIRIILEKLHLV